MYCDIKDRKIFWFEKGRNGNPVLVKPDGGRNWVKNDPRKYNSNKDKHAFRRAHLVMKEYGIWDATAFGAMMQAMFFYRNPKAENEYYAFSSIQDCDKNVNPYIDEEDIKISKQYVDEFYNDVNLQAGWTGIILHPVCFKITVEGNTVTKKPWRIKDIASNYSFIESANEHPPHGNLDDESILMNIKRLELRKHR